MGNLAYDDLQEETRYEVLDGGIVNMSPRPAFNHVSVGGNIYSVFADYLKGKQCVAILAGCDLYLSKKDIFVPDVMIVCDRKKIRHNGVHGAPDLVVEVLSPSTSKRDRGYKKDTYEKSGVSEYWIVDVKARSVEVYLLTDGRYVIDYVYTLYPDYLLGMMSEDEIAGIRHEIKTSLYDDLLVPVSEIFENTFEDVAYVREDGEYEYASKLV